MTRYVHLLCFHIAYRNEQHIYIYIMYIHLYQHYVYIYIYIHTRIDITHTHRHTHTHTHPAETPLLKCTNYHESTWIRMYEHSYRHIKAWVDTPLFLPKQCGHTEGVLTVPVRARCSIEVFTGGSGIFPVNFHTKWLS